MKELIVVIMLTSMFPVLVYGGDDPTLPTAPTPDVTNQGWIVPSPPPPPPSYSTEKAIRARKRVRLTSKVKLGMTRKKVLSILGKPWEVHRTTVKGYATEQWVLTEDSREYLYFTNGVLTGIQD